MYIYICIYIYMIHMSLFSGIYDPALPVHPHPPKGYGSTGPGVEMIPACGWGGLCQYSGIEGYIVYAGKKVVMIPAPPWVGGGGYVSTGVCK